MIKVVENLVCQDQYLKHTFGNYFEGSSPRYVDT